MSLAESFARSGFARFINSLAGRVARIVAGLGLIGWGWALHGGTAAVILLIAGLIPLSAGLFDLCIISPMLGGPLSGDGVRKLCSRQ